MSGGNNFIASIDIGADKIAISVAERKNGNLRIIGHSIGSSAGVRKGEIKSPEHLSSAILKILKKTNESINAEITLVCVNFSDKNFYCCDQNGRIRINQVVKEKDVKNVLDSAQVITTPANKEVLHAINKKFTLNETQVTEDPIAMEASVLESEVHIVTVSSSSIRNIEYSLQQSGLHVDVIALDSIALSHALLTPEEKDIGVCLLDFGAGVTNFSVLHDGYIVHSGVIPLGGDDITQEVAFAFDTSTEEARRIKEQYGCAKASKIKDEHLVGFEQTTNKELHYLSNLTLAEVIEQAYVNILSLVKNDLKNKELINVIKGGFVLCGGAAEIDSFEDLVIGFFSRRAKKGSVQKALISGLDSIITDYRYSCSIGLLLYKDYLSVITPTKITSTKEKEKEKLFGKITNKIKGSF